MILPGPARDYALPVDFALVEALEREGNLPALAKKTACGTLLAPEAFELLKAAYRHARCFLPEEALERHLAGQNVRGLTAELLLAVLGPLLAMGAVSPAGALDITGLRRFFLGVMGWPPRTVLREARLLDLQHAFEGFVRYHGRGAGAVTPEFMSEMMQKFPDKTIVR